MTSAPPASELPEATLRPERRFSVLWLVPFTALLLAGWLAYRAWSERGIRIAVQFEQGHGLRAGDDLRYRGIAVGKVSGLRLAEDQSSVVVTVSLSRESESLARAGTRFWIVRPQFGLSGVAGLETVVGPRYVAMLPGSGKPQMRFLGQSEPPVVPTIEPGDLEIVLQSMRRGGLRAGAPVLYRQVAVGIILSVDLTSDGSAVEAHALIRKAFAQLICPETKFWSAGGIRTEVGISGFSLSIDSLEALMVGGVELATPPSAGEVVHTGHRFQLEQEPDKDWLNWKPLTAIGSSLMPSGVSFPAALRAKLAWRAGRLIFFKADKSKNGWVLQTEQGLLGPADLLSVDEKIDPESVVLEVAGRTVTLQREALRKEGAIGLFDVQVGSSPWPKGMQRIAEAPEECVVITDSASTAVPLSAARLKLDGRTWRIDSEVSFDETWHGACVVSRSDGMLLGFLLVGEDEATVALLPQWLVATEGS